MHRISKWERETFFALFPLWQCYEIINYLSFILWQKARVFVSYLVFKCKNGNKINKNNNASQNESGNFFLLFFSPWQCYEIISLSFILWQKSRVFASWFSFKCKNGNLIDKNCTASQNESGKLFLLFSLCGSVMK